MPKRGKDKGVSTEPRAPAEPPKLLRVLEPDGSVVGVVPEITSESMLHMYRSMLLVRLLDERMMILQRQGRVGFYGACTGQEAPPIGTVAGLEARDWIFPALREGVAMLHRGYDLETYIAQVFGNSKDVLKGRQMPSHYADRSVNVVSWGSCIGTQLPQAVGAAWAAKLRKDDVATVGFMGDGATSESDFHTAMGFAAEHKLPTILICQNNHWSISIPTRGQTRARTIAEKAVAYAMPFVRVDGNDVLAAYSAVREARERARRGEGATFIEMLTYRIGAHSSSDDPRVYRDENEVVAWKAKDPIERYRRFLIARGIWSDDAEESLTKSLEATIIEAVRSAEAHPAPPPSTLFEDLYGNPPPHLLAQARERFGAT
ncbi:MAG: 3-methyl-2-oxobutanoate dehydrogenase [Deltaproteobacteria bacterium]|nr:3-methyl-2-oxobutanoate dehydrogenase [Deltaproteobacteria bacterium]